MKYNALRVTRTTAVGQIKQMVDIINELTETVVVDIVEGEEIRTKVPIGMQVIMAK